MSELPGGTLTFLRAKLHRVVCNPDPIVRLGFGPRQFVIAQAQEP